MELRLANPGEVGEMIFGMNFFSSKINTRTLLRWQVIRDFLSLSLEGECH
jgi:hypothetical protein